MRVWVTGASGLVGSALVGRLRDAGHQAVTLVRRAPRSAAERSWDLAAERLDPAAFSGADAVVHLAGASIASGRWTRARKALLRDSRVGPTRRLAEAIAAQSRPPRVLISASAVGFYGDRGDQILREDAAAGAGFLPELAAAWEDATAPAARAGVRVVRLRTGLVMAREGGALPRMATLARFGLSGPLGSGRQWWPWISLRDLLGVIERALGEGGLDGAVNAVAPEPVRQREFARALGRALRRPAWLPAPSFALRIVLGEMADEALLASARVVPARLEAAGHAFHDADLDATLSRLLGGPGRSDAS
jgi:hypothetical protein